jgi:sugar phosphate isomerase/epimerase
MIHPAFLKEELSVEQQRGWLIDGLRQCAERAQTVGLMLIAENIDYPPIRAFMGRGTECRDICAKVDSPAFRLIYDSAAALFVDEDPLATLKVMAPYVVHVHLKNNRLLAPGEQPERFLDSVGGLTYTGTLFDEGVVDLSPILAELECLGYEGYFTFEYQGEDDPRPALRHNIDYLNKLLAGRRT